MNEKNPVEEEKTAKTLKSLKQMGKFFLHNVGGGEFHTGYSFIYHASPINIR